MNNIEKVKNRLNITDNDTEITSKHKLREVTQELVLAGLFEANFFSNAVFHGGTSLRLVYGIERYSEDLDFTLLKKDKNFKWKPYLEKIKSFVGNYGCNLEISDKSKDEDNIKKAWVKDNSIEQMLNLSWTKTSGTPEKIKIKLEADANPPDFFECETKTLYFPEKYNVNIQKTSSLFSGKCHALLCREYEKGRDMFDLDWFVKNGIEPNYKYLDSMLEQQGPWKNQHINSDKSWLSNNLLIILSKLNFEKINNDIMRFSNNIDKVYNINVVKNIIDTFNSEDYKLNQNINKKSNDTDVGNNGNDGGRK